MREYSEEELIRLRIAVGETLSKERFAHTRSVEKEAARIALLLCPEEVSVLRAAALLHDITKELSPLMQEKLCRVAGVSLPPDAMDYSATLHEKSAPARILLEFSPFALPEILQAVRRHTTGNEQMTLRDKILFVADFIEETRQYEACQRIRAAFWAKMEQSPSVAVLNGAALAILQGTLAHLATTGRRVENQTQKTYEAFLKEPDTVDLFD